MGRNRSIFAHVLPDIRRNLHRRVVTALKPGGLFLLEAYTPEQVVRGTGGPSNRELTMSLASLREERPTMEFIHAQEIDREVVGE